MTIAEMRIELESRKVARDAEYARYIHLIHDGVKDIAILLKVAEHASAIVKLMAVLDCEECE